MTVIEQLRKHSRVEIVDDERGMGNGVIVTLRKGWTFDPTQDKRVAAADTCREAWEMVRHAHPFAGPWQDSSNGTLVPSSSARTSLGRPPIPAIL